MGRSMMNATGQRFDMLVAVRPVRLGAQKRFHWVLECDCGQEIVSLLAPLRRPGRHSCGCLRRQSKPSRVFASVDASAAYKEIGSRIRNARRAAGLTVEQVALELDYESGSYVSKMERGDTISLDVLRLASIAEIIGTSLGHLLEPIKSAYSAA